MITKIQKRIFWLPISIILIFAFIFFTNGKVFSDSLVDVDLQKIERNLSIDGFEKVDSIFKKGSYISYSYNGFKFSEDS
jgi:energy-coupling factor transporter transmembrane protein EcfT